MFNPLMAGVVCGIRLSFLLPKPASVLEFGNQRLDPRHGVPECAEAKTTEEFYKCLGFEPYVCVDINNRMGARVADLNEPMAVGVWNRDLNDIHAVWNYEGDEFDLVTNNGTGEHIFNQYSVFYNAHACCRVGGLMVHVLPLGPWLNHGFYNYNPILFRDLSRANGYQTLALRIGTRWGRWSDLMSWDPFCEKNPAALQAVVDSYRGNDVSLVAILRKVTDSIFRTPLQGKYLKDIENEQISREYA